MSGLLRAEWIRWRRRPDAWGFVITTFVLAAFGYVTALANARQNVYMPAEGEIVPPDFLAQQARQVDAFVFPLDVGTLLRGAGFSTLLLWLATLYLGAAWLGLEHERGTIRNVILARPGRTGFVAARAVTLAVMLGILVVGLAVLAAVLAAVARPDWSGTTPLPDGTGVLLFIGAVWVALVAAGLGAMLAASIARSGAGGMVLAFLYVLVESVVGHASIWTDAGQLAWIPQLLPVMRLGGLVGDAAAAAGMVDVNGSPAATGIVVPPLVGTAIVAGWIVVVVAVLVWRIRRMDVLE